MRRVSQLVQPAFDAASRFDATSPFASHRTCSASCGMLRRLNRQPRLLYVMACTGGQAAAGDERLAVAFC